MSCATAVPEQRESAVKQAPSVRATPGMFSRLRCMMPPRIGTSRWNGSFQWFGESACPRLHPRSKRGGGEPWSPPPPSYLPRYFDPGGGHGACHRTPPGCLEPVVEVEAEIPPVLPGHAVGRGAEGVAGEERRVVPVLVVLDLGVVEADEGPLREGVVVPDVQLRGARVRRRARVARDAVRHVDRVGPEAVGNRDQENAALGRVARNGARQI